MNKAETADTIKKLNLLERAVFLNIYDLARNAPETTVQQAGAITQCQEARSDETCAYYKD